MSGNMWEILLDIIRRFKAAVDAAMETLNSKSETKNTKLAKEISSRIRLKLHKNSRKKPKRFRTN
jgi:hypothetical protein